MQQKLFVKLYRYAATICALFFSCTHIFSQEISFSHISINDGLSTNFVNCICQDKKGFLWIGTENGLQRYDGTKFVSIGSRDDKKKLPSLPVDQLVYDSKRDIIWVCMGQTVGRFNPVNGDYTAADVSLRLLPKGYSAYSIHVDAKNNVILTIGFVGEFVFNDAKNIFEENPSVIAVPENFSVFGMYEDKERGWFYLFGKEGLRIFDPHTKRIYDAVNNPYKLPELELTKSLDYIHFFYKDSKKRIWIKSWKPQGNLNIYLIDSGSKKLEKKDVDAGQGYFDVIGLQENHEFIWAYGVNILNMYDNDGVFYKGYTNNINTGINFSVVKQVFEDIDKNFWLVTDNGLYETIITDNYVRHGTVAAFSNSPFTHLSDMQQGYILGSCWGGGICILKYDAKNLKITYDSLISKNIYKSIPVRLDYKQVWSVLYDSVKHLIILGCQAGNIIQYNTVTHQTKLISLPIFGGNTVRQIVKDNNGDYWYGTQFGRIIKQQGEDYILIKDFTNTLIAKLLLDNKGLLWVATGGMGLQVINPSTNKIIRSYTQSDNPRSIASNHIHDILQLNDSIYVLCPIRNLDVLNTKANSFLHITTNEGLPNNTIYAIVKDQKRNIWMTTNDGISKYNFYKNEFYSYSKKEGLANVSNNNDLLYTGTLLSNKFVMFGGEAGKFIIFNPDSITNKKAPKDVTITDIRLFNSYLPVDSVLNSGGFNLKYNQNTVTIDFNSLMYAGDSRLNYYYRLKGASDQWVRADRPYSASYASLSPGTYVFEVKCVNADGIPSVHTTSLNINIAKPYWQTWWFIALIIVVALIPVYIIYSLRLKRFEAVQKIREKVARDLHDDVGSTLTSINILSEFSKSKVDAESEVKNYLDRISNTSSQMMDAMDDIVWNIKPSNDTMEKIEARMREYAAAVFEPKDIAYRFIDNDKVKNISLNMDVRRSLVLIFKETLNNIAKYANANLVTIEFELKNNQLMMRITDDGIGFNEAQVVYGNGIENMQKRAKGFKGSYEIKSYPDKGTHVLLIIPLIKYYT